MARALGLGLGLPFQVGAAGGGVDLTLALDLNFLTGVFDPRLTFTRTTTGTHFGSDGLLKTAPIDGLRFDHHLGTGVPRGILLEDQRTNLVLHCRDLSNAVWVKSSCTAAKNQIGIDGAANSASSLTATGANATCLQSITSVSSIRSQSAYVKRLAGSGAIEMTMDNVTWTPVAVTSSWARAEIPAQTMANPIVGFRMATSGDIIAVDFVQMEVGAIPTAAIATTTVAVARTFDNLSLFDIASFYNTPEGTFYIEFTPYDSAAINFLFVNSSIIPTAHNHTINSNAGSTQVRTDTNPGGIQAAFNFGALTLGNTHKIAFAYKQNDYAGSMNGATVLTDTSGIVPVSLDRIYIGRGTGATKAQHFRRIVYWNTRKPNADLQALSTL